MIAALYMDDKTTLIKKIDIPAKTYSIRLYSTSPIRFLASTNGSFSAGANHIWRYEFYKQIGYNELMFVFAGIETQQWDIPENAMNIGFEEPTEKVNLDILKNKLRNNKDLKKQLLNFFRK